METRSAAHGAPGGAVTCSAVAVMEVPDGHRQPVRAELEAGRRRWSVGGCMAEGPRWWRGELAWDDPSEALPVGTRIELVLDGRAGQAVVEARIAPGRAAVRGISPPPFDVP